MRVTLVKKFGLEEGEEVEVSKLSEGRYDLRINTTGGGGFYNYASLNGVETFVEMFGHLGQIYVSPSENNQQEVVV